MQPFSRDTISTSNEEDESSHNRNHKRCYTQGEKREKQRDTSMVSERRRSTNTHTYINTLVEAHVETHSNINTGDG